MIAMAMVAVAFKACVSGTEVHDAEQSKAAVAVPKSGCNYLAKCCGQSTIPELPLVARPTRKLM